MNHKLRQLRRGGRRWRLASGLALALGALLPFAVQAQTSTQEETVSRDNGRDDDDNRGTNNFNDTFGGGYYGGGFNGGGLYGGGIGRGGFGGGGFYGGGFGGGYGVGNTAVVGVVQGTVAGLDLNEGKVTIRANGEPLTLNAHPEDLAGLNPGDVAELPYLNYNGVNWLEPGAVSGYGGGYGGFAAGQFGQYAQVTGTIDSVDRQNGRLQISGRWLRAHPEQLEAIYPGQFLSVTYATIGNRRWIEDISDAYNTGVGVGGLGGTGGGYFGGGGYGGGGYGGVGGGWGF